MGHSRVTDQMISLALTLLLHVSLIAGAPMELGYLHEPQRLGHQPVFPRLDDAAIYEANHPVSLHTYSWHKLPHMMNDPRPETSNYNMGNLPTTPWSRSPNPIDYGITAHTSAHVVPNQVPEHLLPGDRRFDMGHVGYSSQVGGHHTGKLMEHHQYLDQYEKKDRFPDHTLKVSDENSNYPAQLKEYMIEEMVMIHGGIIDHLYLNVHRFFKLLKEFSKKSDMDKSVLRKLVDHLSTSVNDEYHFFIRKSMRLFGFW
ncbi:hypothetical protein CROQUDRAFT_135301 [Cronartium quercuum f. sp. fusiforme G11]|uniref:Uncharacterized protein n=1 Tax=Cronartium quercuum f. sp. fusiforme G11 TaxID=708437 RepID=A0A9P6NF33_9BASI|nr:hypothetical protein CROQUDRAFT_135301 [Cronartium quercuum f. sp. fusiforme G11]